MKRLTEYRKEKNSTKVSDIGIDEILSQRRAQSGHRG
jgi:hypothetical protein